MFTFLFTCLHFFYQHHGDVEQQGYMWTFLKFGGFTLTVNYKNKLYPDQELGLQISHAKPFSRPQYCIWH